MDDDMKKKWFMTMVKQGDEYYVVATKGESGESAIFAKHSMEEMLNEFEIPYSSNHIRSERSGDPTAQNSALLHYLSFLPRVINMSLEEAAEKLFDLKKGVEQFNLRTAAGSMHVFKCNGGLKNVEEVYEAGKSPDPSGKQEFQQY